MRYIRELDIPFLFNLVNKAKEQEDESKLFEMYLSVLPHLKKSMSFIEWKKETVKSSPKKAYDIRSKDEIMKDILEIEG